MPSTTWPKQVQNALLSSVGLLEPVVDRPGLPLNADIWINNILPFVGMGHFVFVAGVSKEMKEYYKAFCDTVKIPQTVKDRSGVRQISNVDTLRSVVDANVWCRKYVLKKCKTLPRNMIDLCCAIVILLLITYALRRAFPCSLPLLWDTMAIQVLMLLTIMGYAREFKKFWPPSL
jgi:hypothetical protein